MICCVHDKQFVVCIRMYMHAYTFMMRSLTTHSLLRFPRLIHNNNFEESVPLEIGKLHLVTELQFDENLTSAFAAGTRCIRKFRHW